ncbi:unnamed protein product [Cuscuta campestris]|uniref:CCHC-type domain-containing protein n=1 Tax=Cuscuta campestris TaxID=132261 RepID=A0A484LX48_9ASTE|nr:unnamed protein product [Cuscuta campestris]
MVNNMDHGLPKFSLLGYDDWKIMMEAHLYALHDCMWMVLEDGPLKIQMKNPERNPAAPDVVQYIPKPKEKWDDRDCKKHNLDNVAKAAIFKTLDPITFSKIKHLKTAMEIWQGLGKLCEGSEDLRKQKIEVLLEKFKSFKMLSGESFDMLDERFHKILNDLASLNHILSPKEKNVRLLRSLPTEWYTKAIAMEKGRNLENYTVQGLLDALRTYEHELKKKKKEEQVTPFPTALTTTPRIPSSEGTCTRNCDTPSSNQPSSSKMENYDEEFAMMVKQFRKFKKFFKKADSIRRPSKGKPQVSDSPPESYLCYNCRKPGHWKSACPYPKVEKYGERERNEKKKKAMVATESDESSSSSSDEEALVCMERRVEKSNHEDRWTMSEDDTLCLMAKDDADQEVTSQTSCSSSYSIPTSENIFDQFKKMMNDFEEINLKHSSLTEENKLLSEENLKLTESRKSQLNEITQLKTENESLSEKVKSLNKELGILKSQEAVNKLLETTKQKGRKGLGFDPSSSKGKGKTTFIPPKPTVRSNKQKGKEKEKPTEVPKKVVPPMNYRKLDRPQKGNNFRRKPSNPQYTRGYTHYGVDRSFPRNSEWRTMQRYSHPPSQKLFVPPKYAYNRHRLLLGFCKDMASLKNISTNEVILTGKRIRNIYQVIWNDVKEACLISKGDTNLLWLWHKRLSHLNFKTLNKLSKEGLVEGLPKAVFRKESICDDCQKGKQRSEGTLINQAKYTRDLIKKFKVDQKSSVSVPMSTSTKLDMDVDGKEVDQTLYRGIVGSLLYLTASRPDISYAVGVCARFESKPKESHLIAAKRILRYLKGTQNMGLWYAKSNSFELVGYSDSDFAGCKVDRKSTSDLLTQISEKMKIVGANIHFQKLEAKCSSPTFYQSYLEMIAAQELSEFLHKEIRFKYENEVLEFYKNGKKKLGEKLHLPNSGVEIGRLPAKNLDWNIIGISGQAPSGPAKKTNLNNDYKLVLELVIACLECGSGGHADDITQERAFIINALITKSKSLGAASEGKKYKARYWLYYLSSKGENRAGASTTVEESSSDNVLIMSLNKSVKRKQVVSPSPSAEAPQNLAPINLEEEEEFSAQGELQRKKKRKITSPSTSGYVNPDELKEKETTEETSAHNRSPQQLEEEIPQVQNSPTSSQPQIDDAENQFWQLYSYWRAWKVGNSAEQLLSWDQQLKNEKIIKKCLGLPVNYCCEQILDVDWVWQRNYEDLHLEHMVTSPISEFEVDDEDPAVYKPVLSKTTEDQVVLTSEAQANLVTTAEDFQIFPETSSAFETALPEAAISTPQKQNQEGSNEELQQLLHSEALEILTNPCEITNPTKTEIPEKSAENLEMSKTPETNEAQEEQAVEAQRSSAEAEKETQMAELEASESPVAIFEEQNEAEERDSLSRDISNFTLGEAEEESERTLKINDEEDVQDDAESLPMQLFQRTPSSNQVTNFHFHSSPIPTLPDEVPEIWTKKVQGLIESALASQHASFRQEIEQMEARHNKLTEKSEETHCSNLREISKSVDKTLEILSLLSNTVSNTMETYASDSYLQLKEVNKIREQIANVTRSNPENSTQRLSSSGLDGTEAVGTIAAHFSNENQTEERRNNIRRIKELCGNMQGIREIAESSKHKKH